MISIEVIGKLDEFFEQWNTSLLKGILVEFDKQTRALKISFDDGAIKKLLRNNEQTVATQRKELENKLRQTFENSLAPRNMYQSIFEFENIIRATLDQTTLNTFAAKIKATVKQFENDYNKYNKSGFIPLGIIDFIQSAIETYRVLTETIESYREMVSEFKRSLGSDILGEVNEKQEKRFSLLLYSNFEITSFAINLIAINIIYTELANLVGATTETPLRIVKIESGSFWADLLGYPKVLDLMQSIIENTISYFHRNFTLEGKISEIPRKVDTVEAIIHLRKQLKVLGINTDEVDENIKKSTVILSKELNRLLLCEAKVKVNDKTFSVGQELEQKYLEQAKILMLPVSVHIEDKEE